MTVALIIGGALIAFLFMLDQSASAAAAADSPPVDTSAPSGTGDTVTGTAIDRQALLQALGVGIATGEGFYRLGTVPQRQNNPGDLKVGGRIATFSTVEDGFAALNRQLDMILNGSSKYYDLNMSLKAMCAVWIDYPGTATQAELDNYTSGVVGALNNAGFAVDETVSVGALARGDF